MQAELAKAAALPDKARRAADAALAAFQAAAAQEAELVTQLKTADTARYGHRALLCRGLW